MTSPCYISATEYRHLFLSPINQRAPEHIPFNPCYFADMTKGVESKQGEPIHVGDKVVTRVRGGKHEGVVNTVLETEQDIQSSDDLGVAVKNPPKVVFTDQHGHRVSHNPGTLSHVNESE
ncbi:hypothetical protein B0H21DRAFT_733160 [Amylocystis lapponica]|nr:hypothetical protein B0H21DRAFT_733160 [Amylocystis lapponica]